MRGVAREICATGQSVLVVALLESDGYTVRDGVPSIGLGCARVSDAIFILRRLIRRRQAAVVVSTLKHVTLMVAVVQLLSWLKFRHIARVANTYSRELARLNSYKRVIWRGALALCHRLVHRNICVSLGVESDLVSNFGVSQRKCIAIPNPVDTRRLGALAGADSALVQRLSAAGKIVLSVGRLTPQKDFEALIKAFHVVANKWYSACSLVIVGEGPERRGLESLIENLGLRDKVHLLGWIDNPYPLYKAADVFVLSSRFEGLPNVILEALAFGLPVVATDCESGPREILVDRYLGELVPVGDLDSLAQAMRDALQKNKDPRRSEYISERFAPGAIVHMYERAILDV